MAELRIGHHREAGEALLAAKQSGKNNRSLVLIANFYHAMNLIRQNRAPEAREMFIEAEARMRPLPEHESKPLANGAHPDHLIMWLACKEAKDMLEWIAP